MGVTPKPSWVYFIQEGTDGPIKIGYTAGDPVARLSGLQTGNPNDLYLIAKCNGDHVDERSFHNRFAHLRVRGEWFRPDAALLDAISAFRLVEPEHVGEERGRLDCGLDGIALGDIADYVEARRLYSAAHKLMRRIQAPPSAESVARLTELADEIHACVCGGGPGVGLFGREALAEKRDELLRLAESNARGVL